MQLRKIARGLRDQTYARLPRRTQNGSSLVLAYHNIVHAADAGAGDSSLHLSVESFESQLKVLQQEADVVSLPELLSAHSSPGRRVAVTFDDAYGGCVRNGLGLCKAYGIKPTVFVAPALLGMFAPWDVRSARGMWSEKDRMRFLLEEGGIAADMAAGICEELPGDYRISGLKELQDAAEHGSADIGNHTMKHVNLAVTDRASLIEEVSSAQMFLDTHFADASLPLLAYPYGNTPIEAVVPELLNLVDAAFLVSGGWMGKNEGRGAGQHLMFKRLNVPAGVSVQGFRARIRGWLL